MPPTKTAVPEKRESGSMTEAGSMKSRRLRSNGLRRSEQMRPKKGKKDNSKYNLVD